MALSTHVRARALPVPRRLAAMARVARRREALLLAGIVLLTRGITSNFGNLSTPAILLVLLGLLCTGLAMRAEDGAPLPAAFWGVAVAACAATTLSLGPAIGSAAETAAALTLTASVAALMLCPRRAVLPLTLVAGASVIALTVIPWSWVDTSFDVRQSVMRAAAALLHGQNPYLTTFVTPDEVAPHVFVPVTVHFQYLPGVALLGALGQLLGDVRVTGALAMLGLIAACVALARQARARDPRGLRVLALCLALPMTAVMILLGWVDVYSVAGFAGWLALRRRHPRWAVACLALALTIKPTILVALLPAVLWSRRARLETACAVAGAALVILPFAVITGPPAFFQDVLGVQAQLGSRTDSLTLDAWTWALAGTHIPVWFEALLGALAAGFALSRRPRSLSDVLLIGAFLSTALLLVAKWAFLNYYFVPAWLLVLALAAQGIPFDDAGEAVTPSRRRRRRAVRSDMSEMPAETPAAAG